MVQRASVKVKGGSMWRRGDKMENPIKAFNHQKMHADMAGSKLSTK
jgi:hypothetical protein